MSRVAFVQSAEHVLLNGSNLTIAETVNNITDNHYDGVSTDSWNPLLEYVAPNAMIDATERNLSTCYPGTRLSILKTIEDWARGNRKWTPPVYWVCGAAGAGKSAIAQKISKRLRVSGLLGATFFFSRGLSGCNESKFFVRTLAYQLALSSPSPVRRAIKAAISRDPLIFCRNLEAQATKLIVEPLKAAGYFPPIIVIDGLDECTLDHPRNHHEKQQREILLAIDRMVQYGLPLRFLITSRPDRQLRECFQEYPLRLISSRIALDESLLPSVDIEYFLRCRFMELRAKNPFLDDSWPSEPTISQLVSKSSGCFIYSSTVIQYISQPRVDPRKNLENILQCKISDVNSHRPIAELDALYLHIFESVDPPSLPRVLDILCLLWHPWFLGNEQLFYGVVPQSPEFMARMLLTSVEQIYIDLIDLHSIVHVPPTVSASSAPISPLHSTLIDFLLHPERSGKFHLDKDLVHVRCQQHLLNQSIIANSFHPCATSCRRQVIEDMFIAGLEITPFDFDQECPPSPQLKLGLEAIMSSSEIKYFQYLELVGLGHLGPSRRRQFRDFITWVSLCHINQYYWRCSRHDKRATFPQQAILGLHLVAVWITIWLREIIEALALIISMGFEGFLVFGFAVILMSFMLPSVLVAQLLSLMWGVSLYSDVRAELIHFALISVNS